VSSFFIESFQIPPFLMPIFQAAGTAYGIPWQVLAAINEVETDYGRDLSVSSTGSAGWMQFLPAEWAQYGVDANGNGYKDPTTRPTRSSPPRAAVDTVARLTVPLRSRPRSHYISPMLRLWVPAVAVKPQEGR
jgi:Transglycosylase SLT domain